MDLLKKIKIIIEEISPKNYSLILALPIILLIFGFLIWNFYLYTFGLQEDQILKAKFISTGLLFFLFSLYAYTILNILYQIFVKVLVFISSFIPAYLLNRFVAIFKGTIDFLGLKFTFIFFAFLLCFLVFVYRIFPFLPASIGGGQPNSISLITSGDDMYLLNSLNINLAEGAKFQTENLCIIQQDEINVYIVRNDRVLMLSNSLFKGMASLPGVKSINDQDCISNAKRFSLLGLVSEIQLTTLNFRNFWHSLFAQPLERLYIGTVKK